MVTNFGVFSVVWPSRSKDIGVVSGFFGSLPVVSAVLGLHESTSNDDFFILRTLCFFYFRNF